MNEKISSYNEPLEMLRQTGNKQLQNLKDELRVGMQEIVEVAGATIISSEEEYAVEREKFKDFLNVLKQKIEVKTQEFEVAYRELQQSDLSEDEYKQQAIQYEVVIQFLQDLSLPQTYEEWQGYYDQMNSNEQRERIIVYLQSQVDRVVVAADKLLSKA